MWGVLRPLRRVLRWAAVSALLISISWQKWQHEKSIEMISDRLMDGFIFFQEKFRTNSRRFFFFSPLIFFNNSVGMRAVLVSFSLFFSYHYTLGQLAIFCPLIQFSLSWKKVEILDKNCYFVPVCITNYFTSSSSSDGICEDMRWYFESNSRARYEVPTDIWLIVDVGTLYLAAENVLVSLLSSDRINSASRKKRD